MIIIIIIVTLVLVLEWLSVALDHWATRIWATIHMLSATFLSENLATLHKERDTETDADRERQRSRITDGQDDCCPGDNRRRIAAYGQQHVSIVFGIIPYCARLTSSCPNYALCAKEFSDLYMKKYSMFSSFRKRCWRLVWLWQIKLFYHISASCLSFNMKHKKRRNNHIIAIIAHQRHRIFYTQ